MGLSPSSMGSQFTSAEQAFLAALADHVYTNGQLAIGNSATGGVSFNTITAGSGVTITNGNGTITIAATTGGGGTVTSVTSADANATVANTTTTPVITIVSAPKWATARNLAGNSVDGSANIAFANKFIVQGTADTGLSGAQFLGALGTGIVKNTTTTGVLSIAAAGTDYEVPLTFSTGLTRSTNTITVNVSQNITTLSNLTSNGLVTTSGGAGTLGVTVPGTGILTWLTTPSSANLAAAVTDETGTGALVFANTPTLTTAILGSSTATTQSPSDNSTKVATTAYVDAAVLGQNFKEAAKYATTAALPAVVYNNGTSGVGATLTAVGVGAISLDGNTPSVGDRVLVKNQVSTFQNGIYTVTVVGTGATVFVLTRATDANTSGEWKTGDSLFVTSGTAQATTTWAYTGVDSPTMGTDAFTFAQTAGQGSFTAGNGIAITGNSIAIDTSVTVDKTTAQTLTNKTLTSPVLTTPSLGVATATSINGNTFTTGTYTLTGTAGKTLNFTNTLTLSGTDGTTMTFPSTSATIARTDAAQTFTGVQTLSSSPVLSSGAVTVSGTTQTFPTTAQTLVGRTTTDTLTNKRITRRVVTTTQSATPTINTDNTDMATITGLAQAITSFTTNLLGTPSMGDFLEIQITDNGTARAIAWGTSFVASTVALPTTTVISTLLHILFEWDSGSSKWICVAVA